MRPAGHCTRPDLAEMVAPYVLGACGEDEAIEVRDHLAACGACREAFGALLPAREGLLVDVAPAAPPEALRSRVMDQVRADAALFAAARERRAPAPEPASRRLRTFLSGAGARLRTPRPAWALGIAALVAVVLTVGLEGPLGLGGSDRETVYAARVDGVAAPGARASLAIHGHDARLRVSGLPAAGPGRMYQVWLRDGATPPRPAGVRFAVDAQGDGRVSLPALPRDGQQVLVTSEKGGDARAPTRTPILRVSA